MIARRERWSYAVGDLGFNVVWQSIELYLLFYYIRALGIAPAVASMIFLAGAAVDWLVDPLIGALADRLAPRIHFRLWVLLGGPCAVLLLTLAFAPWPALLVPANWVPAVALLTYLALRATYGIGNIPYGALTARMSTRTEDHLALTSARMQGAAIGGLVAALIFALLPPGTGGADFRDGAILLAILAVPAFLATFLGVRERVAAPLRSTGAVTTWRALGQALGLLGQSAQLRRLLATILACGLAITVVNKSLLFLFEELGALRLGYFVALVPAASLLLTTPVWAALAARFGASVVLTAAALLGVAATSLALMIGGILVVVTLTCVAIIAGCGMSVMFWSLVPAAVADCERAAASMGCAGRVYALANMARKLAQALAPSVVALTLSSAGSTVSTLIGMSASATIALAVVLLYRPRATNDGPHTRAARIFDPEGSLT